MGELLRQIEPANGGGSARTRAVDGPSGRKAVATAAGLSARVRKTALRIAAVPKAEFEELVESDPPLTVAKLAKRGASAAIN